MIDNNNFVLPSIEGSSRVEALEQKRADELRPKYELLEAIGAYCTGNETLIFASAANGRGISSYDEGLVHLQAAEELDVTLKSLGFDTVSIVPATRVGDIRAAIRDPLVRNIFLLGHATLHTWLASDGRIDWYIAGKMVKDHLKDGVFANLGCGGVKSWNYFPVGNFVVSREGTILGKKAEYSTTNDMGNLSGYRVLKHRS